MKYSPLIGYWKVEIGPLNQVIGLWSYDSLQQRDDARKAAAADSSGQWPPKIADLLVEQNSDILIPGPTNDSLDGPRPASARRLRANPRPRGVAALFPWGSLSTVCFVLLLKL